MDPHTDPTIPATAPQHQSSDVQVPGVPSVTAPSGTLPTSVSTPPPPVPPPSAQPSEDTINIVTILLLIFLTPIGIIVMWVWAKWKTWIKVVLTALPLLLFVAIGIMLSITLVAINPAKQFREANNTLRMSHMSTYRQAIIQLDIDKGGTVIPKLPAVATPLASTSGPEMIALCEALTGSKGGMAYLAQLPIDPLQYSKTPWSGCQTFDTGYTIQMGESGPDRKFIDAPLMEKSN